MKISSRTSALLLCLFIAAANSNLSSAVATTFTLSMTVRQTPSATDPIVTLFGQLKPAIKAQRVRIEVQIKGTWQGTTLAATTAPSGTWKVEAVATALDAKVNYRAIAVIGSKRIYSVARSVKVKQVPVMSNPDPTSLITEQGPGGRIHGMDISRWQHPGDAPIDFVKMYGAGIRFIMIKAADTKDLADAQALKYLVMDHNAAQSAGIYTGYYYYATLPDSTDTAIIVRDAQAQAQKAIWRLGSLGGYTNRDLSFALDLENNCVRVSSNGTCTKYTSRNLVTLWATTWLAAVADKTGRAPIIYSYPQFLENAMTRSADLLQYPLWVAHYSLNPFDPLSQPGLKTAGCFVSSWTTADCSSLWTVWQYTSCGIANKYGVPGTRVDLDVFRGTPGAFLELVGGTWTPQAADLMPVLEPSVTTVESTVASTADKSVVFMVNVNRPSGLPVVTGTVNFNADPLSGLNLTPIQSAVRSSSGRWTLTVKGLPAGTWNGSIVFTDVSGTHASSFAPIQLTILPTPTPTPKATPTPTPTKKSSPAPVVDSCKYQIKN